MSGIVGILHRDDSPVDPRILRLMTEFLAERGPDGLAAWSDGPIGLGSTQLCTEDNAAAEQQLGTLDGQCWITADARLDSRSELLDKLQRQGSAFPTPPSDAQLILHAYHCWGDACLEHLQGDFAFAIWDARQRRLWCARDHFGVKPFYYAAVGQQLLFSNTLECLRLHPEVSARLDDLAIADFLLFGGSQEPDATAFRDIRRLPPAHTLEHIDGALRTRRYWTLPVDDLIRYARPSDYLERFQELFVTAVSDRLRSSRAAVMMSGGLDSTSVAAVARSVLAGRDQSFDLRAYTADYRPLFEDEEASYAARAADFMGIPIEVLCCADSPPYDCWEQPDMRLPEPVHEPFIALQLQQWRRISRGYRVALSGDGGDNLLQSESWPYLVTLWRERRFGRMFAEFGGYVLRRGRVPPLLGGFRTRFRRWLGRAPEPLEYPAWISPELGERLGLRERWDRYQQDAPAIHPLRPKSYASLTVNFWSPIFELADPGVTRAPVEIRAPFFDLRLVRYLLAIPPVPWCAHKELLRVGMKGLLPESVRRRPKSPLARDPLIEHIRRRGWRPRADMEAHPALSDYVNVKQVPTIASSASEEAVWLNLGPTSLNYWLLWSYASGISGDSGKSYEARAFGGA